MEYLNEPTADSLWHGISTRLRETISSYDNWFAQGPNNASLAAVGLYTKKVPEFAGLLAA